jgi:DEAD/DEAH box helicase
MSYPRYTLESSSVVISCETSWALEETVALVVAIFDAWLRPQIEREFRNEQTALSASLIRRTEGLSGADVYELTFFPPRSTTPTARFIIRSVRDSSDLDHERRVAQQLSQTGSDWFASSLLEGDFPVKDCLVYRHVDDSIGAAARSLKEVIVDVLRSENERSLVTLTERLRALLAGITRTYEGVANHRREISWDDYFNRLRSRLPPDLVVDATERQVASRDDFLIVSDRSLAAPLDLSQLPDASLDAITQALDVVDTNSASWVATRVRPRNGQLRGPFLRLSRSDEQVWVRLTNEQRDALGELRRQQYALVFPIDGETVRSGSAQLEMLGFVGNAYLPYEELLAAGPPSGRIVCSLQHTDLHGGNVLDSGDRSKVIDLSSTDWDLPSAFLARLEFSIWECVTREFAPTTSHVKTLLNTIATSQTHLLEPTETTPSLPWYAFALGRIVAAIRSALSEDAQRLSRETVLAYCAQGLLFQRYSVENEASRREAFATVIGWWFDQLRQLGKGERPDFPNSSKSEAATSSSDTIVDPAPEVFSTFSAADSESPSGRLIGSESTFPTVASLWRLALASPGFSDLTQEAAETMEALARHHRLLDAPVTSFQLVLWNSRDEEPFQSDCHVILAAPTSTGKSTLAQMFLARPSIVNTERPCAVYIAPTRALAQARYRELHEAFAGCPHILEGLALVTGEDDSDNWRLPHGRFSIACMVYENANILFSRNRRLLQKIGCIVVDEMHMLNDLERGPTLEMALTKALLERTRIDSQASRVTHTDTLRVVAITTEQGADEAITRFLSVLDATSLQTSPPLLFRSGTRPIEVHHNLVLSAAGEQEYLLFPVVTFSGTDQRCLSKAELAEIDKRLHAVRKDEMGVPGTYPREEVRHRLTTFLVDRLSERPKGYLALVFVPGRAEAEEMAKRLRNALAKSRLPNGRQRFSTGRHRNLYRSLKPYLDRAEDQRMANVLRPLTSAGILVHHADIDKQLRLHIEDLCTSMGDEPSIVLFATETLSYGVNLAVNDVLLLGVEFNSQTRLRESTREMVAACAYHNMTGRAGRLGRSGDGPANVFVFVPDDQNPLSVVEHYYTGEDTVGSRLYVADDRARQLEEDNNPFRTLDRLIDRQGIESSGPCTNYSRLGVLDFTYPVVRTVLDGLRHLNIPTSGGMDGSARVAVEPHALDGLFGATLYGQSLVEPNNSKLREATLFRCGVERILDSCAKPPLQLVSVTESEPKLYSITDRGEAIIDTGTEVSTVEPVLRFMDLLYRAWRDIQGAASLPSELYLLALLTQREVYRGWIRYTPESNPRNIAAGWGIESAQSNRAAVARSFEEALSRIGVTEYVACAQELHSILASWDPIRGQDAAYNGGTIESIVRFFNGVVSWVMGDDQAHTFDLIEADGIDERLQVRMQGFRQFTELMSWKVLFLAKMLSTARGGEFAFGPEDQRQLLLLASRLRLGCTPEAIPLFWPRGSNIGRRGAEELLRRGASPGRILTVADPDGLVGPSTGLSPAVIRDLRHDLQRYAIAEFNDLSEEATAVPSIEARREAVNELWNKIGSAFAASIEDYRETPITPFTLNDSIRSALTEATETDGLAAASVLNPSAQNLLSAGFRVRLEVPAAFPGIIWHGERLTSVSPGRERFARTNILHFVAMQMRSDWTCRTGPGDFTLFAEWLSAQVTGARLVIIPIPWTPPADELPSDARLALERYWHNSGTVALMSPAAFAVMLTAIVRDWVTGEDLFTALPARREGSLYNVFAVRNAVDALHGTSVPQTIRDKLIPHFEADVWS